MILNTIRWMMTLWLFVTVIIHSSLALGNQHEPPPPGNPPQNPEAQERTDFEAMLRRLRTHTSNLPHAVTDILNSLTGPQVFTFNCPQGSAVDRVEVTVETTHRHFDRSIRVNNQDYRLQPGQVGGYHWIPQSARIENKVKKITFANIIMFDPASTTGSDGHALGRIFAGGLFYHELLHGQLQIDAMKNATSEWARAACACQASITANDQQHQTIPALEKQYMEFIAGQDSQVTVGNPDPGQADDEGDFEIDLGPYPEKQEVQSATSVPGDGNIDDNTPLTLAESNGRLVVRGRLQNKTKPGFFFVYVDPPGVYYLSGTEHAIMIKPPLSLDRNTTVILITGGILLVLLLLWAQRRVR